MSKNKIQEVYTKKEVIKALLSGIILGTLIAFPFILLAINLLLLYIYHVTIFSFLLLLVMSGWIVLIDLFYYKTLKLYRVEQTFDYRKRFIIESLVTTTFILLVGMIVVIFIVPNYI